ncbi:MAG: polysaccharide deacetylase family protein [Myxococcales bacterium]|nr:polysaccharide deacetylase family protein [Myxococcales bacterium]
MRSADAALALSIALAACDPSPSPTGEEPGRSSATPAESVTAAESVRAAISSLASPPEARPTLASSTPVVESARPRSSAPRFLPDNPRCPVPNAFDSWSWRRVHRVEGLTEKAVVFTLDVGAKLPNLELVLDVLKRADIKTTIFLYTAELSQSERGKAAVRRMVADGHELANHTLSHKDLTKLSGEEVERELDEVERFVSETTRGPSQVSTKPFFREPFLATNDEVDAIVRDKCYRPIWFTIDTADWEKGATAEGIERHVFEHQDAKRKGKPRTIENGSIFIFHGSVSENVVALPRIIERLRGDGFAFLTLGEALRRAGGK